MDPGGMMNEAGAYNLAEIWPYPINGGATVNTSMRSGVSFGGPNLVHQFSDSNLISNTNCNDPARMSHALSQAVVAGIAGARKRRDAAEDNKVVSGSDGHDANDGDSKKQKTTGCEDEVETGTLDQKKQQLPEPPKDYIHVRARRGQATDSHSLAERARREKISERMKILQDLVPGCNKVIGKALVLDEIINYIQSLQRQVEFLSMKLEAVNSRMTPGIEVFPPKEFDQQTFENQGMQFGAQATREYSRGASPEWLHMQERFGSKKVYRLVPNWKRESEVKNLGYKVHGNPFSTSTRRVLAVLLEKGLSYESITVDLKSGEHKTESFLSLNPFGQIPVFVDGNIKLHESRAITQYIAYVHSTRGTQLLYLQSHETMAILTVWMEIEAHQFDPFASKLTWEQAIKPIYGLETDQVVVKENEANLEKVLDIYEKRLGKYRFLACNTFTLADLHHLPNIQYLLGTPTKRLFEDRPKVLKWVGEITGREAWKMACDHEKYWFGKQTK